MPINIELSNIPEQRILLNKIDNARAYYALTILGDVRHAKRIQLSGFSGTSYDMKLVSQCNAFSYQRDVRHAKRKQLSKCLCNIVHMYVGISCGVLVAQSVSYGPSVDVARYKMLSGTSRQQVSRPNFGRKKTPDLSVRG